MPESLTRDPITNRMICSACWNGTHDNCTHLGCRCMHHEATDAMSAVDSDEEEGEEAGE